MARAAFLGSVLLHALVVVVAAALLPERVPLHFGAGLEADRYGSRTEFLVTEVLLLVGITVLFAGCAALVRHTELAWVNVPYPEYWKTPEHEAELRRRLGRDVLAFGAGALLFLAAATAFTVHAAVTGSGRLSLWFAVLLVLALVCSVGWCAHLVLVRYVPPGAQPPPPPPPPAGGRPASDTPVSRG